MLRPRHVWLNHLSVVIKRAFSQVFQRATANGTAIAGVHYEALHSILRFEPNEQVKWLAFE